MFTLFDDPLFWLFPVAGSAISMGAFMLFAIPMTWVAWRDPASLRHRRIQGRRGSPENYVWPSIHRWVVNNAIMTVLIIGAWPLLRLTAVHAGPLPPWWQIAGQLVVFIYIDDFLYYWMHRSMHGKELYKRVHSVHHRLTTPWAIGAHYMHPIEFVLTATITLAAPVLVGSHVVTIWLLVAFRQWIAAEGHCGYRIPYNPSHLFPGYGGNEFHDFHHSRFVGNYSGFLGWFDRVMGTTSAGYLEAVGAELGEP